MSYTLPQIAKAVTGTAGAFVAALITGASDGHITLVEWLIATGAALAVGGGVFQVDNARKP